MKLKKELAPSLEFLLLTLSVIIYFVWFSWPLLWSASENSRLLSVFFSDESVHTQLLKKAIEQSDFKLNFYFYGQLFFNVALLPLYLLNNFIPISEQHIIITLRLVATIFGIATASMTFILARRYFGHLTAWLATALLLLLPVNFLHWSTTSHPDTAQMFFIVLSIYFCSRLTEEKHWKWMAWASVAAGLAFASKYSGLFLLPIIWMIVVIQTLIIKNDDGIKISAAQFAKWSLYITLVIGIIFILASIFIFTFDVANYFLRLSDFMVMKNDIMVTAISDQQLNMLEKKLNFIRVMIIFVSGSLTLLTIWKLFRLSTKYIYGSINSFNKTVLKITVSVVLFFVSFVLTSPFSFVRLGFVRKIIYESKHVAFGHVFKEDENGLLWFNVLISPQLLDIFIVGLAVIGLVLLIYRISKSSWEQLLTPELVIWAWVIFYFGFQIVRINMRVPRFLLPILPFLLILAIHPIQQFIDYATTKLSKQLATILTIIIIIAIGMFELPKSFNNITQYREQIINREQNNVSIEAGKWLAENYPPSTPILYDVYSYIPPSFIDATNTWSTNLKRMNPDVIVVHQRIASRYSDTTRNRATEYADGEEKFIKKYKYYKGLKNETIGFVLVRDFGDVQIYEKQ